MDKNDIKISYTILTHNETNDLKRLLEQIITFRTIWDEIIIVDDFSTNEQTLQILEWAKADEKLQAKIFQRKLEGDFSSQKNYANSLCSNEYIFNIDADEYLDTKFAAQFREIVAINPEVEYFRIPRVNKVEGLTLNHINKWRWQITGLPSEIEELALSPDSEYLKLLKVYKLIISEKDGIYKFYTPIINWPDSQGRIYKNKEDIQWVNKVHEIIIGYKKYSNMPLDKQFSILHYKQIDKQELQNNLYQTIKG